MAKQKTKGFTIIEVVLVLAIGALILLMALIAWPAMQKGQRDDARKRDASLVVEAVTSYTSNNRGDFPDNGELRSYLDEMSGNIEKDNVRISRFSSVPDNITLDADEATSQASLLVVVEAKCGKSTTTGQSISKGTSRQFATIIRLEQGNGQYYCIQG